MEGEREREEERHWGIRINKGLRHKQEEQTNRCAANLYMLTLTDQREEREMKSARWADSES